MDVCGATDLLQRAQTVAAGGIRSDRVIVDDGDPQVLVTWHRHTPLSTTTGPTHSGRGGAGRASSSLILDNGRLTSGQMKLS